MQKWQKEILKKNKDKPMSEIFKLHNKQINKMKFKIGNYVYLKTDVDQYKRIVTGYTVRDSSEKVVYLLSLGTDETSHYECEISNEEDIIIKTSN